MDPAIPPCLIVGVGAERFGLDTARVRRVIESRPLTPIPGRPRPFLGALNFHGELLAVAPLAALLGRRQRHDPLRSAVVILGWDDGLVGLLAERTFGVLTAFDGAKISQVLGRWEGPHLRSTFEADGHRIHLLDPDSLLAELGRRI